DVRDPIRFVRLAAFALLFTGAILVIPKAAVGQISLPFAAVTYDSKSRLIIYYDTGHTNPGDAVKVFHLAVNKSVEKANIDIQPLIGTAVIVVFGDGTITYIPLSKFQPGTITGSALGRNALRAMPLPSADQPTSIPVSNDADSFAVT